MALENLHNGTNTAWALWKIDEEESALAAEVAPHEVVPPEITNIIKRREYLAGRVLVKTLLGSWALQFHGLRKDGYGKPFLKEHNFQVSLSHSYPYVAAVIDRGRPVGIDLEQPKEKLLRVAARVLHPTELADAGTDMVKHCLYWCAKETLVKVHGKKDLTLAENLRINPFLKEKQGELIGRIIEGNRETTIPLQYHTFEKFVVVLNK
jgi:4'-phosphopantetheinyl transferase